MPGQWQEIFKRAQELKWFGLDQAEALAELRRTYSDPELVTKAVVVVYFYQPAREV